MRFDGRSWHTFCQKWDVIRENCACSAECFLLLGCLTTEYIPEEVVADQCAVFLGAKIYTRTPEKNKTILPYYNFHQSSHLQSEYYVSLQSFFIITASLVGNVIRSDLLHVCKVNLLFVSPDSFFILWWFLADFFTAFLILCTLKGVFKILVYFECWCTPFD